MNRFFLLALLMAFIHCVRAVDQTIKNIGIVGLGSMGKPIVECYSKHGYDVHAWNRGETRRDTVKNDMNLENVTVHDGLEQVLEATNVVLMVILGGKDLVNAESLIKSVPSNMWKNKTLVQYSAHEPVSAKKHNELVSSVGGKLVAGAIFALPASICSSEATMFVSSSVESTIDAVMPTLEPMGTVVRFDGDPGYAALVDVGILQSLYFGITGHEMAHLLIDRYGASDAIGERYTELATELIPLLYKDMAPFISKGIMSRDWQGLGDHGDSVAIVADCFSVHLNFFRKMGVPNDSYLDSFMKYLNLVPNRSIGASAWIEQCQVDKGQQEL